MKKILSLSLVALFAVSALAQQQLAKAEQLKPVQFNENAQRVQKDAVLENATPVELTLPSRKAKATLAAAQADTLDYLRPSGAFFVGMSSDLGQYYPRIICDTVDTMTFYNVSAKHTEDSLFWVLTSSSGTFVDTTWNLELDPLPESFYYYPMPSLVTVDTAYEIVTSYQYGSAYADKSYVLAKPAYTMPLTTCAMYTDTLNDEDSQDFWIVSAGDLGTYSYGSNLNMKDVFGFSSNYYVDTLITVWDNLTTLYADSAFLTIYRRTGSSIAEAIPAGASIKLELFPLGVNAQGKMVIDWNNPITSTSATNADANLYPFNNGGFIASLNFAFGKKNALGGFTPEPVYINGPFVTVLSGISSNGCDFGIYTDYFYSEGQTYFVVKGGIYQIWRHPSNILLSINSQFVAEDPQGVENTSDDVKPVKVIRDGQILIQKGEKTFTVMGTEF